jgi:glutaredoxin
MERTLRILALIFALALAAGSAAAGNLYKWTDKDGNVHYTDQLPPPDAKVLDRKKFTDTPAAAPASSYALQQAVKNFPVTLYNADSCDACAKAATFLTQRGVPFTERNARDATVAKELKALTGGKLEVPVMQLGSQVIHGYEEGSWKMALDAAGYPTSPVAQVPAATATPKAVAGQKPQPPKTQTPNPEAAPAGSPPPSTQASTQAESAR